VRVQYSRPIFETMCEITREAEEQDCSSVKSAVRVGQQPSLCVVLAKKNVFCLRSSGATSKPTRTRPNAGDVTIRRPTATVALATTISAPVATQRVPITSLTMRS